MFMCTSRKDFFFSNQSFLLEFEEKNFWISPASSNFILRNGEHYFSRNFCIINIELFGFSRLREKNTTHILFLEERTGICIHYYKHQKYKRFIIEVLNYETI